MIPLTMIPTMISSGTISSGMIAAAAGSVGAVALAAFGVLSVRRRTREAREREAAQIRQETEAREFDRTMQIEVLRRQFETLETSLRNSDEILREDRLNHSTRGRAMQLLRAGIAPDSAAVTLGMARVELRLLAKVSRVLTVRK